MTTKKTATTAKKPASKKPAPAPAPAVPQSTTGAPATHKEWNALVRTCGGLRQELAEVKAERDLAQAKLAPYPVSFTLRRD